MKPFKLKDPLPSSQQLVRLAPKQCLELTLTDLDTPVTVSSPFLEHSYAKTYRGRMMHWVTPTEDITEYAHLTTHYLGEVMIGNNCKLILYMNGEVNKETITVINPFSDSIRMRPFETIEFIYCSDHDKKLTWSWELKEDIDIDERAYKQSIAGKIPKVESSGYFAHPRKMFKEGERLHHFWFTLGKGLLATMQSKPEKHLYVGRLCVEGSNGDDYDDSFVDVYCDLKPKWRMRTVDFITGRGKGNVSTTVQTSHRVEKSLPKTMQVDFEPLETKCIYAGCNTMEFKVE